MRAASILCALLGAAAAEVVSLAASNPQQIHERSGLDGKSLRILPLGASITYGKDSSSGNGYRQVLQGLLSQASVTFIGDQCSGSMSDSNNEGHPGFVISQMQGMASPDLQYKPNVVLLYVGTNDMVYPVDPTGAPARMAGLVSFLSTNLPGALIVVGNLFLDTNAAVQARIDAFNSALPGALAPLQQSGANVVIADMSHALTASDLAGDGEHPIDSGYAQMAQVFFNALVGAESQGKIPAPEAAPAQAHICNPAPSISSASGRVQAAAATTQQSAATSAGVSSSGGPGTTVATPGSLSSQSQTTNAPSAGQTSISSTQTSSSHSPSASNSGASALVGVPVRSLTIVFSILAAMFTAT